MYTATVPTCTRALNNLAAILEKAAAHAEARKIAPAVLLNSRLFPDMFPLATQIHAGQTWNFQCWYRDASSTCGASTNLSNGLSVGFTP